MFVCAYIHLVLRTRLSHPQRSIGRMRCGGLLVDLINCEAQLEAPRLVQNRTRWGRGEIVCGSIIGGRVSLFFSSLYWDEKHSIKHACDTPCTVVQCVLHNCVRLLVAQIVSNVEPCFRFFQLIFYGQHIHQHG